MKEDNDVLGDWPQADEVSEVDSPSLANSEDLEGWGPMNLVCQNAQTHQMVQRDQIWSAVSLNWVMDVSGWNNLSSVMLSLFSSFGRCSATGLPRTTS